MGNLEHHEASDGEKASEPLKFEFEEMSESPLEKAEKKLKKINNEIIAWWRKSRGEGPEEICEMITDKMCTHLTAADKNALAESEKYESGATIYDSYAETGEIGEVFGWEWENKENKFDMVGWATYG